MTEKIEEKELKEKEKTMQELLKDPVYVSYNVLSNLEEIKKINFAIFEILNALYQRILMEEKEPEQKDKEKREGVFK